MFQLFALVVEALAAATDALLSGDKHVAAVLAGRDELSTTSTTTWGAWSTGRSPLEARDQKDLRFLLAALRVVPELERSHELAEHIARPRRLRSGRRADAPRPRPDRPYGQGGHDDVA